MTTTYHAVVRDGTLLGYAPEGDDYPISEIVLATPAQVAGHRVGLAIARDVRAEGTPHAWTGLDPQDGDELTAAGIEPDTADWEAAEEAARDAFLRAIKEAR